MNKILEKKDNLQKVIVMTGPTASGKTDWSLRFAKKYNGDILCVPN